MIVMGVDPGLTGGLAVVKAAEGRITICRSCRMPVVEIKGRKYLNSRALSTWMGGWHLDMIIIEQVSAMPRQGVTSSFSFGRITGAVEAVCMTTRTPVEWVTPSVWKKHFKLDSNKRKSLDLAAHLFDDSTQMFRILANEDRKSVV